MYSRTLQLPALACLAICAAADARAGGAYVVDDAAIGKPGECQIESWSSHASNGHLVSTVQPACVVELGMPVEFTASFTAARAEVWRNFAGLQAKVVPLETKQVAIAVAAAIVVDTTHGDSTFGYVYVPVTLKLHDRFRLNLNAGALWDEGDHFTWGASLEWDFAPSWTLISELFGVTGASEAPRTQIGLRFAPAKTVDLDIIYGNNLTGEHAQWITGGVSVRF